MGDPTPIGWFITALYLAGTARCARTVLTMRRIPGVPAVHLWLWGGLALLLLGLGLNKQLDLHDHIVKALRDVAQAQGWYPQRRLLQWTFLALFTVCLVVTVILVYRRARETWDQNRLAMLGVFLLTFFILMRAVQFNHLLEKALLLAERMHLNDACEAGGILLIVAASFRAAGKAQAQETPRP